MDSETQDVLQKIRNLSKEEVQVKFESCIPTDRVPPPLFWSAFSREQISIGRRSCLLLWVASRFAAVPREFQLQSTIALLSGKDVLIDAGTGYGKTLCMILPCLLWPETTAIIISPLKCLQAVQVLEFERYGIITVAINEDTPNDPVLWKKIRSGYYSALLVQPEQLFMIAGHMPRFARLIAQDRHFTKRIKHVHVNEAHFIFTAGLALYGLPAFRSAWGRLGEFRIKLGKDVRVMALSGTQPPHIKKKIKESLLFKDETLVSIELSSNRPNIIYATHPIVNNLSDWCNLDFLVPDPYPSGFKFPKTLVFHDNITEATAAALYNNGRLPEDQRNKGIIKHYHSGMSKCYLTQVYDNFSRPDGTCRILHATEGASTGLDIPDIEIVIQYGIPRDVPTTIQRGGRGGRLSTNTAIFLILYEPWVKTVDSSLIAVETSDPDHPIVEQLTKFSTKQQRTGMAMVRIIQLPLECLRRMWRDYAADKALDAMCYTALWCCDRHPGSGFHIRRFFKGRFLYQDPKTLELYYGDNDEGNRIRISVPQKSSKRKQRQKYRPVIERDSLVSRLVLWRIEAHTEDPYTAIRPPSFIIDDKNILKLARLPHNYFTDHCQVTALLGETPEWQDEWSTKIFDIVHGFDCELSQLRKTDPVEKKTQQKRARIELDTAMFQQDSSEREAEIAKRVAEQFKAFRRTVH